MVLGGLRPPGTVYGWRRGEIFQFLEVSNVFDKRFKNDRMENHLWENKTRGGERYDSSKDYFMENQSKYGK